MALSTGRTKLFDSHKTLRQRWDEVREVWKDPVQKDFEEHTWEPLEDQVKTALRATDRLALLLEQMGRECS